MSDENQKKTLGETSSILHCSNRKIKEKIIDMVRQGKISSLRKTPSNQYIKNPKKVSIKGTIYNTVSEAAKTLGIGRTTIYYRIKNGKNGYEYVK